MSEQSDYAEAQRIIEPLLAEGERVRWAGRPDASRVFWRSFLGILAFVAFLAAIVYFFYAEAATGIWQRMVAGEMSMAGYAFPAALTGLFLWVLGSSYRRAGRTAYALTDRRLLSTEGAQNSTFRNQTGAFGTAEWSLFPEHVAFVRVQEEKSEVSDVVFNEYRISDGADAGSDRKWVGFQQIADPQEVAGRVRDWLKERERVAVAEAEARRAFTDPAGRFRLDVPATWPVSVPSERTESGAERVYVLGAGGPLNLQGGPGIETLVERYGPLGASFALAAGPVGSWRFEEMSNTDSRRWGITEVMDAQPDVRVGGLPGFVVTVKLTVTPRLFGHASRGEREARIKFVVLTQGERQYRFALAWLCAFPAMKEPLEDITRSFQAEEAG